MEGTPSDLGFALLAIGVLTTTTLAFLRIRSGNVQSHREWMAAAGAALLNLPLPSSGDCGRRGRFLLRLGERRWAVDNRPLLRAGARSVRGVDAVEGVHDRASNLNRPVSTNSSPGWAPRSQHARLWYGP